MSERVRTLLWAPEALDTAQFQEAYNEVLSTSGNLCEKKGVFDYQLDTAGEWTYFNHSCARLCPPNEVGENCFLGSELVQENPNEILFVTEIKESILKRPGGPASSARYFVPVEQAYKFNFGYSYDIQQREVATMNNLWQAPGFKGSSSINTYTVILNRDGERVRDVAPSGAGIELYVSELLDLAGRKNWLDEMQPEVGINHKPGAQFAAGPIGRLTGVQIDVHVSCYNKLNIPQKIKVVGWDGPVCAAQIRPSSPNWVWRRMTDKLHGKTRHVLYHGVLVRVHSEGKFRFFDLPTFLTFIVESIVLLQLPASFLRIVAVYCLGHLSLLYGGVLNQRFSLAQHVAGTAMHLLQAAVSYHDLSDNAEGISLFKMSNTIKRTLKDFPELNESELNIFVVFCFAIAQDFRNNRYTNYAKHRSMLHKMNHMGVKRLIRNSTDDHKLDHSESEQHIHTKFINSGAFMTVVSIHDQIAVDHVVQLFDRDRSVGILERVFLPRWVRDHVLGLHPHRGVDLLLLEKDFENKGSECSSMSLENGYADGAEPIEQIPSLQQDCAEEDRHMRNDEQQECEVSTATSKFDELAQRVEENERLLVESLHRLQSIQELLHHSTAARAPSVAGVPAGHGPPLILTPSAHHGIEHKPQDVHVKGPLVSSFCGTCTKGFDRQRM